MTEFLGRARYQRAASAEDARPGCRNGYCPTTIQTTAGPVTLERPKLRGTTEAFASRLFGVGVTKTNALASLVIAGFVRGLSTRDVEATLADALGAEATLSKSTVSRVCEQVKDEFTRWRERRLDDLELDYLFLDASHFKMHPGARAEPVLAAWGITTEGKAVLVTLGEGASESTDTWNDFLDELTARGLTPPLLVISDGAGGLINATETVFGRSLRQRCLIHRARNVLAKVPIGAQDEVKNAYWALFDVDDLIAGGLQPGQRLVDAVQARIDRFAEQHGKLYPRRCAACSPTASSSPAICVSRSSTTAGSGTPTPVERTFGETRRRTKVIGRLPGQTSCLSLVWAVLDRASRGWRGLTMTPQGLRLLQDLRRQLLDPPTPIRPPIHDDPSDHKTVGAVA
ncbi:MAG: IS256 family transposase [Actinomycetes bacterium]